MILSRPRARAVNQPVYPNLVSLTEGTNIPLEKPIILVGRHQECDIQIPSRKISRRHCCIALISDHLVIRDLGSTNGIRINGIKVVEGNLQPNDELTIGNMRYQVRWGAVPEAAPGKNAVMAAKPIVSTEESLEEPMPLSEVAQSHPVLQGQPKTPEGNNAPGGAGAKLGSLEIPDNVGLAPLDPPGK